MKWISGGFGAEEGQLPTAAALENEERAELAALFATPEAPLEPPAADAPDAELHLGGPLAAKAPALLDLEQRSAQAREELLAGAEGRALTAAEDARLGQLRSERDAALHALLPPAEREHYELRNSPAAAAVRTSLEAAGVVATEGEFRRLYQARVEYEQSLAPAARGEARIGDAWQRYLRLAAQVLGPDRTLVAP